MTAPPPASAAATVDAAVPRRVWTATALQVVGRVVGVLCTLGVLWLVSRQVELDVFGRFTFTLALFAVLDGLVNLGTGQVAVQRTADDAEALLGVVRAARRVRLGAAAAGWGLVAVFGVLADEPGLPWLLLAALYPFTHALELSSTVYRNRIDWRLPVLARTLGTVAGLLFVIALAARGVDEAAPYVCAVAAGSALANVGLWLVARSEMPRTGSAGPSAWALLRVAAPLGIAGLCAQLYFYVDNVFVRVFSGEAELGPYNVAVRFLSVLIMIAQYASAAALPWLARRHAAGELGGALVRLGQPLFALFALVAGALTPFSAQLLRTFHPEFDTASVALQWLFAAAAVIYAGSALVTALVATGNTHAMLRISATALAFNVVANFLAVPRFGIAGAAATTLATEALVALGAARELRRHGVRLARPWGWSLGLAGYSLGYAVSHVASVMLVRLAA